MKSLALLSCVALSLMCPMDSFGQTSPTELRERKLMMFRVSEVNPFMEGFLAEIPFGLDDGLFVGSKGVARSVYNNGPRDGDGATEIGFAEVAHVADSITTVAVILKDSTSINGRLYQQDVLELAVDIPIIENRTVFFDLVQDAIFFLDRSSEPLFSWDQVLNDDGPALQLDLEEQMSAIVRETARVIRPIIPDNPEWDIPIDQGRYAGLKMVDAMDSTSTADIHAFLLFVKSFPGKYLGNDWRVDETYATWLINNAPPGQEELRDMFIATRSTPDFNQLLNEHAEVLADGVFTTYWNNQAEELAEEGRFEDAIVLIEVVERVAEHLGDQNMRAYMLFSKADIMSSMEQFDASLDMYRESVLIFRETGDIYGESIAVNNLGRLFNDLNLYEEGLTTFVAAINLKNQRLSDDPQLDLNASLASSFYGQGNSVFNLGRFEDAILSYGIADSLYQVDGSLESQRYRISAINQVGKTYVKLSQYDDAIAQYEVALAESATLGDSEGQADALDEISYVFATLGKDEDALLASDEAYKLHIKAGSLRDAGYSQSSRGQTLWRLLRYDEAIAAHLLAIQHREEAGYISGQAYSWTKLGALYKQSGDPIRAIEAYASASALYRKVDNQAGAADVLEELGDLFIEEDDFEKAIETHNQALEIRRTLGLRFDEATSLNDVARALYEDRRYEEAATYYTETLALRRELGDQSGIVYALANLANLAYFNDRDYDEAQSIYADAIALAEEIGNDYLLGYCNNGLAQIASDTGDIVEAKSLFTKALGFFSNTDDLVNTLLQIGHIHLSLGEFELADLKYEEARTLAEEANSNRDLANVLQAIGSSRMTTGLWAEALQFNMQSLRISTDLENTWGMASANTGVGNAYNLMGANALAVNHYLISDSLYVQIENELARATPINNIGDIYYNQGDYLGALPYFEKAFQLQKDHKVENEFTALIIGNVGATLMKLDRLDEAEVQLMSALKRSKELGALPLAGSMMTVLGQLKYHQERFNEALEILAEALELVDFTSPSDVAEALLWIGESQFANGDVEDAITSLLESVERSEVVNDPNSMWKPRSALGKVLSASGDNRGAIEHLTKSVEILESLSERLAFGDEARETFEQTEDRLETYEKLISLLIEEGETELALSYIEKSNVEAIRENLAGLQIEFTNPEKTELIEAGKEKKAELAVLERQISKENEESSSKRKTELITALEKRKAILTEDYLSFVDGTVNQYPELAPHLSNTVNPGDFTKARRAIPKDTAVLAYLIGKETTFIFTATSDSVNAYSIPISSTTISSLVAEVHGAMTAPGSGIVRGTDGQDGNDSEVIDHREAVTQLYRVLIGQVEDVIEGKQNLAIIPSGSLYKLPFQILSDAENGKSSLLMNHTVFYTSKLDVFGYPPLHDELSIVAFGDADDTLDWAEREVNEIAKIHPGTQVYVQDDATESRVKNVSSDYNVLHLATHGTLDYNNFQNSFFTLALDDESDEDGQLNIEEIWKIQGLDNYRLVTLSACESAISDDISRGWPISPANAFLRRVQTVVASLWKVDDVATSLLMQAFYTNLETMGTAESLRMAQLSLSKDESYSDPFYWAPFVVMGDWR